MSNFADQIQAVFKKRSWIQHHWDSGLSVCIMGAAGIAVSEANDLALRARFFNTNQITYHLSLLPKDARRDVEHALNVIYAVVAERFPERLHGMPRINGPLSPVHIINRLVRFNDHALTYQSDILHVLEEASRRIEAEKKLSLVSEPE